MSDTNPRETNPRETTPAGAAPVPVAPTAPEAAPETMAAAPPPRPPAAPATAAAKPRRGLWPALGLIGFLLLAAGELYLWRLCQAPPAGSTAALAALQGQIAALQANAAHPPAPLGVGAQAELGSGAQADLAEKFAALTAQVAAMQTQLVDDHGALTTVQAASADLTRLAARIELLDRLESARIALESGLPLGDIPNAPPALRKFATLAPPTQAALQMAYPAAAAAANAASIARADRDSAWAQALARVESLVTISNGAKVLIGPPAAAVTAQAQAQLNAGDLAGAVATLTTGLSGPTQAAMGGWLAQAQALLAARAAIVTLSGQG